MMSALVDYGDLSEWSLFGDQMLMTTDLRFRGGIPLDTDSLPLEENPLDSDSGNMAEWYSDCNIGYLSGVTTTLKVLSCPMDEEQLVVDDLSEEQNDKWRNVVVNDVCSMFEESLDQLNSNADKSCLIITNNSYSESCPVLSPDLVLDRNSLEPGASAIAAGVCDEVCIEEEYVEVELKNESECDAGLITDDDVLLNLVSFDDCHSICFSEDDDSLSSSSTCDTDNFGTSVDYCWTSSQMTMFDVNDSDRRMRKKEQNKSAAMRYRLKKRVERGSMQSELESLRKRNVELKTKVEQMTRELGYLKELVGELDV